MAWIFETDGDYVNFNGGGNLWRLHKESSCISWHWDNTGDLFFDVYDQAYSVKAGNIADVIIDGVPLSAASDFPDAIRAVFTGLNGGGSSGGSSYLVYTALLSQSGTDAPVATVLVNTLGYTVVWSRDSGGDYKATVSSEIFDQLKTVVFVGNSFGPDTDYEASFNSSTSIYLKTYYAGTKQDDELYNNPIEIRVYP